MAEVEIVLPIPLLPQVHGLDSTTFRPPLLDGSLTIGELFDFHWTNSPDHPVFAYTDDDGSVKEILWKEFIPAIHRAGHYINKSFGFESTTPKTHTVAVLAAADNFTFAAVETGIVRAECSAFLISPRNSPPAIAHLITKTNSKYILVTEGLIPLVHAALVVLEASGKETPQIALMPTFRDLFNDDQFEFLPAVQRTTISDPAFIIHSSGSTSFPKPITWTHYIFHISGRSLSFGVLDFARIKLAGHAVPMFHGLGLASLIFLVAGGTTLGSYKPATPAPLPNPESVYEGAVSTKCDLIFCVPIFIELWSRNPQRVAHLASIKGIFFGGGPLNKAVGDALTEKGVTIYQMFASSEAGSISTSLPGPPGKDWDYFPISPHIKYEMIPDGFGAYELVLLRHKDHCPCVVNTKINGVDAYATSDLLVPHPTREGYWRVFGRSDDQIMHSSGEKTNPGPLEAILAQDPHIQSTVIFGRSRFHAGVIVDPAPQFKFDPSDTKKLIEFRNKIWPSFEKMNDFAPQHSRIFKEMILVASPSKPFVYTLKMTARRLQILADYELEIDALYETVKETTQASLSLPSSWDFESTVDFIRSVVGNVLKEKVSDNDDLFQHGCDSLQATWIRNSILHALRQTTQINTRAIQSTFVYQNASISALTRFVLALISPSGAQVSQGNNVGEMLNLVAKYSKSFNAHKGSAAAPVGDVFLVTGTTGAIGSNVLAVLLKSPNASKIFALNRKGKTSLVERQKEAIKNRGYEPSLIDSPNLVLVEADLGQPDLGLTEKLLHEIRSSVTHIIHIGWRVDFNLNLQSFEANVQGVRNLIDLVLSSPLPSPPRLLFTSSIAVLRKYPQTEIVPEALVEAEIAVGSGYGESKWVAEKILSLAGSQTSLRPIIVRVGQVSGGVNGCWNPQEWIPSIIQSATLVKCLPSLDQEISLIPLDIAAAAIVELRNSSAETLHLAHPKPVSWNVIFHHIAKVLSVPLVPYSQWLSALEASESEKAIEQHSALRLLDFYKTINTETGSQAGGLPKLATDAVRKASPVLQAANGLGENDAQKWLNYWRATGVIAF